MNRILLAEDERKPARVWAGQFEPSPTWPQVIFDALFGAVAPVLCFVFDPIVFNNDFPGGGLLTDFQAIAYLVSGFEIFVLLAWLICGRQLRAGAGLVGGILGAGAAFSGLIGVIILPFSLIGLFYFIGILGFIPFLTSFVYLRNASRALRSAGSTVVGWPRVALAVVGSALALGGPGGVSFLGTRFVSHSVDAVLSGDPPRADLAAEQLWYVSFLSSGELDRLVRAYEAESDPGRREGLRQRYRSITGDEIESRLRILND